MNNETKVILMKAVLHGTPSEVASVCTRNNVVLDDSYFDYELLQAALRRQNYSIINFLLNKIGCRPDNPKEVNSDETPLYLALEFGNEIIIRSILRKGASVYNKNHNGETILYAAFKKNYIKSITIVLNQQVYVNANCVPESDDDILHFQIACVTGHIPAVEHYLKFGIDPNKPISLDSEEYSGLNPVQYTASIANYYSLFKKLVCHGGDLSIKDSDGLSPLHMIFYFSPSRDRIYRIIKTFQNGNNTKFVNVVDDNKVSHFQLCCILNEPDFVKVFIENGAKVNDAISSSCVIYAQYTPLHFAVENGCERVVKLLLKNGAVCDKKNKEGQTPLHLACKISGYWKERIIKLLLKYNASPTIKDKNGCTPIHIEFYCVNSENTSILDMLLSKVQSKVNFTNDEGVSFFHIACATNNMNQAKAFLTSGVEVNSAVSSGNYRGYTALHFAALNNQKDMVEFLLKKNAKVNVKTIDLQITPLHLACEFNYMKFREEDSKCQSEKDFKSFPVNLNSTSNCKNQLDIISLLLSHGAEIDAKDLAGITPLLYTAMIDKNYSLLNWSYSYCLPESEREAFMKEISFRLTEIIKILISQKADMVACSCQQESILHIIARYKSLEITDKFIKLILAEGVKIDTVDDYGLTPLHTAVKFSNANLISILLKFKANVNAKCKDLKIPLHIVIEKGMRQYDERQILVTLLKNGSNANLKSDRNYMHYMFNYNNDFTIEKLLYYGADINSKGSIVNTCIGALYENRHSGFRRFGSTFYDILTIICIHIRKLQALKLHVSKTILHFCDETYSEFKGSDYDSYDSDYSEDSSYSDMLDNISRDCIKELEKMKLIKIDSCNSLYSILIKNSHELSKHVRNESFIEIVKSTKLDKNFPLYSYLVKLQFKRGSSKRKLLQFAKVPLNNIINLDLPDICFDLIMKHLKRRDIANMIMAAPLERNF